MADYMAELDLDAIEARADAATPGPWEAGDWWVICPVLPEKFGEGRCGACGSPTVEPAIDGGTRDFDTGPRGPSHLHRTTLVDYVDTFHRISGPGGATVAGNYEYEEGGIVHPGDTAFIAAARTDVPMLVAEVRRLHSELDTAGRQVRELLEMVATLGGSAADG